MPKGKRRKIYRISKRTVGLLMIEFRLNGYALVDQAYNEIELHDVDLATLIHSISHAIGDTKSKKLVRRIATLAVLSFYLEAKPALLKDLVGRLSRHRTRRR